MKNVGMMLFPNVLMLDVSGPLEVFSIANRFLNRSDWYQITTIGIEQGPVRASNGVAMLIDQTLDTAPTSFDILLVPGGPSVYVDAHAHLISWLRIAAAQSQRYGSICTGAFLMGEAGLLDGHRATTHWNYSDRLAEKFPNATIETDQIYVRDRKLITSGGVTAGIDLALSIVAEDYGKCVALDVAKVLLVVMKRQGGQAQFSPLIASDAKVPASIAKVQSYVLKNIDEEFNIERLAKLAAMSPRHFTRVFTREMKITPMEFVQNVRIDHARQLLETSDIPIKAVAYHSGFGSTRYMRILFSEKLGLTPAQYRRQFG